MLQLIKGKEMFKYRYREIVRNENYQSSNIRRIDSPLKAPRSNLFMYS